MKILVFCPTSRLETLTLISIMNQDVEKFDTMFTRDNPYLGEQTYKNIQYNFEKMRLTAVSQGYDKAVIIESDMIIPPDTVSKMLKVDAPVVSGLYCLRHSDILPNVIRPNSAVFGGDGLFSWKEIQEHWGEQIEVNGGCTGVVMLDRTVLERYSFVQPNNEIPDGRLMRWCVENKVRQVADLSIVCGHIKLNGEILFPDKITGYRTERAN